MKCEMLKFEFLTEIPKRLKYYMPQNVCREVYSVSTNNFLAAWLENYIFVSFLFCFSKSWSWRTSPPTLGTFAIECKTPSCTSRFPLLSSYIFSHTDAPTVHTNRSNGHVTYSDEAPVTIELDERRYVPSDGEESDDEMDYPEGGTGERLSQLPSRKITGVWY